MPKKDENEAEVEAVKAANRLEPTAVRGGQEADADDALPDADTIGRQVEDAAKGSGKGRGR